MSNSKKISEYTVKALASNFWDIVTSGSHGDSAKHLFLNPGILLPSGKWIDLEQHQEMHRRLKNESHEWIDSKLAILGGDERHFQFNGHVLWQATIIDSGEIVKAKIGETWILELTDEMKLKWTLYWSSSCELMPESAQFEA